MPTDNLVDELEGLVLEAVTTATKNWETFHVCLSGGVDSSLLLAILCKLKLQPECTWTMTNSVQHPDYQAAAKVAEYFGVSWYGHIGKLSANVALEGRPHVVNGDDAVWTLFELMTQSNGTNMMVKPAERLLCTDGIDELVGGYLAHRGENDFTYFLGRLWSCHLEPLLATAQRFRVQLRFPYLDHRLADFITRLPIESKTNGDNRKVIWRKLALRYLPDEIVYRRKYGQCSMLDWRPDEKTAV